MRKQRLNVVSSKLLVPNLRGAQSFVLTLLWSVYLSLLSVPNLQGAVILNELYAAPSEHQLSWASNGIPHLGSGMSWMEADFTERAWSSGLLPAGYGFSGLGSDLSSSMKGKAPSLYLRKEFFLTSTQAAFSDPLILAIEYNDGFVAYLNGREVARANCGPTNRFIYASQPAYNVATNSGTVEINLGPASSLVFPGRNVLAIQVHNAEQPSTPANPGQIIQHIPTPEFKINAALRTSSSSVVSLRPATFNFNNAAGGSETHGNTNGLVSDSVSGVLDPGGWLATASVPSSSASWQALQIVSTEQPGVGVAGGGALRFSVSQAGLNQPAALRAPVVDMAGGWQAGSVSSLDLAGTVIRFRDQATAGAQFRLRIDPSVGQESNALSGFPLIAPTNEAATTFSTASGGARVMTINSTGGQSQSQVGVLNSLSLFGFASNDVRSMTFRVVEDATAGAGYNASKGHLRTEITQAASAGSVWGFSYGGFPVSTWIPGNITSQDLAYATFQFACRIPSGVTFQIWAEPGSGGFSNRVDWGTVSGDGTWQLIQKEFAGAENFRNALNTANTRNFKLVFQASASLGVGTWLQVDDFQILPWRKYEVRLADATNGQSAFLNFLNANHQITFLPTLEKFSDASAATQTLTIDDYEVVYTGTNAIGITNFIFAGSSGGPWKYFVGRAEPSGGIFDPGLLTTNFPAPAGEESTFANPAEFVSWVEIYNPDPNPANLSGWSLTDNTNNPGKWHFPANTLVQPEDYLLVLCDGKAAANAPAGPASYLHTSFSLNSDGENLALYNNNAQLVDEIAGGYPKQVFTCSYGRAPINPGVFGYLEMATPGAANRGTALVGRVDAPAFKKVDGTHDLPGGLYLGQTLTLVLTNSTPGSLIRYTLDGSEPTVFSGSTYTGPLTLSQANDKTGVVVRARSFLANWLPSGVKTHSYLLRQAPALTNVPALLFTGQKERTFYKPYGILAISGGSFQTANGGGEIWAANGPQSFNEVLGSGSPFERETHMEYYFPPSYYPSNQPPIREDIGMRVSSSPYQRPRMRLTGAEVNSPWQPWYDATEKPSFNLFFNGDYGISKLDYRLFPNYDIKDFQDLRVRAGKNDNGNPFLTDELVRRLWTDMGQVGPRGLFCSLYLNAIYKGVFNLTERVRASMFQNHYHSTADWDVNYAGDWVEGDRAAFDAMMTALNKDLTNLSNYSAATARLDPDNFADYYLLNIYCAMWDWPENNYVFERERSSGPLSRFRCGIWDAEGAFNINAYYAKPATFNTVTELNTKTTEVPAVWKRLVLSPEFRLRFADRVNRHMFNSGVLDDRDPDGAGPLLSHFQQRFNELATEVAPLVLYNTSQPLATNLITSWATPGGGRRSVLLGTTAGNQILRDAGLWPVTEPPQFSQFGGVVPPGYPLVITNYVAIAGQTATIYFTLDGADPRVPGGAMNSSALLYAGAVPITNVVTVSARAKNDITGEWSPLTQATFAPNAVAASSNNLVLAEIMYHPPDASTDEINSGFSDPDDFEFIRLLNIGSAPIDMANMRFTQGITFDFGAGSIRFINTGENALLVKNRAAFRTRYGNGLDARIAGEYGGNLSNGGERLAILNGTNTIRDFSYADGGAWPESPDGTGPSLLLRDPFANPDHAQPTNWLASAIPGGMPSGHAMPLTFNAWRAFIWGTNGILDASVSGPSGDPDGDGISNYAEYALGLHPRRIQAGKSPQATIETFGAYRYLTMRYSISEAAASPTVTFQVSSNLVNWLSGPPYTEFLSTTPNLDGTVEQKYRDTTALELTPFHFMRVLVTQPVSP